MDLIDRQAAIDEINSYYPADVESEFRQGIACGCASAILAVKSLPSAEPVHCKDCAYMKIMGEVTHWCYCKQTHHETDWDGYCHRAERRTDE